MTVSFRLHVFVCPVVTSFISDHLLPKGWSASTLSVTSFLQWIQCRSRTLDSFLPVASVTSALCLTNITDIFLHDSGPGFYSMCVAEDFFKEQCNLVCCRSSLSLGRDFFVSISDHNGGAMMSIAIFTVMRKWGNHWTATMLAITSI